MTPACMTPAELALWHDADAFFRKQGRRMGTPCVDCPLSFSTAMREKGCCNGRPGTSMRCDPVAPNAHAIRYGTDEERAEARRLSWRMSKRRAKARAA